METADVRRSGGGGGSSGGSTGSGSRRLRWFSLVVFPGGSPWRFPLVVPQKSASLQQQATVIGCHDLTALISVNR